MSYAPSMLPLSHSSFFKILNAATRWNIPVVSAKNLSRPHPPPVNTMLTPPSPPMASRASCRTLALEIKCHDRKLTKFWGRWVFVLSKTGLRLGVSFRHRKWLSWSRRIEWDIEFVDFLFRSCIFHEAGKQQQRQLAKRPLKNTHLCFARQHCLKIIEWTWKI